MAQYDNRQQDERRQTLNYYAGYELASSIYTILTKFIKHYASKTLQLSDFEP